MSPILVPGHNCWRIERAGRVAFLVDSADYYAAVCAALQRARRSIFVLGWDIDSNVRLLQGVDGDGGEPLGDFLNRIVSRQRGLHAHVLIWDFAMIYATERQWLPVYRLGWRTHRRLHFRLDGRHPLGASHHQKVVVVDDAVAFVGGMDMSKWRWDTPGHVPDDPRRVDPYGTRYMPYHDVQMMVDGAAAAALGELARTRWRLATGRALRPPAPFGDPWPEAFAPDLSHTHVAIVRTLPRYNGQAEVTEVRQLYLDAIAAAQHAIYMENQYLTAAVIRDALAARLREPQGPEVVMVLPERSGGWLEQNTMDVLRARLLTQLHEADRHGRLRVCFPFVPGLQPRHLSVHSKVTIIDDRFLRIGSSNLNNRSMGLDTECDLAVDAQRGEERAAIRDLRNRLLGEHLGVAPAEVGQALAAEPSLIALIDGADRSGRHLADLLQRNIDTDLDELLDDDLVDPERPLDPERLAERVLPPDQGRHAGRGVTLVVAVFLLLLGFAAAWRWTPLNELLDVGALVAWLGSLRGSGLAPLVSVGAFVAGGLVVVPVTFLVVVTVLAFGSGWGFVYSLTGSILSAALTFWLGQVLGRDAVRRLAGARLNRLSQRLGEKGVLAIITVRVVPVAPFTVVNLVAGVSHISFRKYMLGTVVGMAPGLFAMSLLTGQLVNLFREPDWGNFAAAAAIVALVAGTGIAFRHWLTARRRRAEAAR